MSYIFSSCKKCTHWKEHDCEIPVKKRKIEAITGMVICCEANQDKESEEERINRELEENRQRQI